MDAQWQTNANEVVSYLFLSKNVSLLSCPLALDETLPPVLQLRVPSLVDNCLDG